MDPMHKLYENPTYFDNYGGSLLIFFVITLTVIVLTTYFQTMANVQPVVEDWANQRCKPAIIPVAGWIHNPTSDKSATEYTFENFNDCLQNILKSGAGSALEPLTYLTDSLSKSFSEIQSSIQSSRAMFSKVRTSMQSVSEEIMGRMMNIMIPLQQIIIGMRDVIGKIQGTMTAGLMTLLGSYYTLKSLMGAIAQSVILILIALASMIAMFWSIPATWGLAASNTVIFSAIAVPMAVILSFMKKTLHINTNYSIPKVKCFDRNQMFEIRLSDESNQQSVSYKKAEDIRVGDEFPTGCGGKVVATIKVATEGSQMYILDGVLVSDSHLTLFGKQWIFVKDHPSAVKLEGLYKEPFLYCFTTQEKIIKVGNTVFSDWDEDFLKERTISKVRGFVPSTPILLAENLLAEKNIRNMGDVRINDMLANGGQVYGIVQLEDGLMNLLVDTDEFVLADGTVVGDYNEEYDNPEFMRTVSLPLTLDSSTNITSIYTDTESETSPFKFYVSSPSTDSLCYSEDELGFDINI